MSIPKTPPLFLVIFISLATHRQKCEFSFVMFDLEAWFICFTKLKQLALSYSQFIQIQVSHLFGSVADIRTPNRTGHHKRNVHFCFIRIRKLYRLVHHVLKYHFYVSAVEGSRDVSSYYLYYHLTRTRCQGWYAHCIVCIPYCNNHTLPL